MPRVLNKATAFLQAKQSADGAWRSETYGLLKSGQSLTPFVLFALTDSLAGNRQPNERQSRHGSTDVNRHRQSISRPPTSAWW